MDKIRLAGTQLTAVENSAGKYLYSFFLAAVSDLYENTSKPDEFEFSAENGYDTFDNLVADSPAKKLKHPLTVMRDAKILMASLFASLINTVNSSGRLPAGRVRDHLVNLTTATSAPVRFMIYTAEALWPHITSGDLGRDLSSVECFQTKIEALVLSKPHVDPGANELARIYVRFLKCVAWATANFSVEHKVTLNGWFLRGLIRNFGALPEVEAGEDLMEFFDDQAAWVAKAQPKTTAKAASKAKAAAAPAPKPEPMEVSAPAPEAAPGAAPRPAPEAAPGPAPEAAPEAAPGPAPRPAPEAAPEAATSPVSAAPKSSSGGAEFSYDDLLTDLSGF